jgi:hypothetical protein
VLGTAHPLPGLGGQPSRLLASTGSHSGPPRPGCVRVGPKDLHAGGWAAGNGDSGGLVCTLSGGNVQACGQISAGVTSTAVGNSGYTTIDWTEAPDILGHYGLRLNPTT